MRDFGGILIHISQYLDLVRKKTYDLLVSHCGGWMLPHVEACLFECMLKYVNTWNNCVKGVWDSYEFFEGYLVLCGYCFYSSCPFVHFSP